MTTLKLSIITPALNAAATIGDALASVQAQRYACYEHIVVDGGSTDETVAIAKEFPNVKIRSGPDKGQSDAMNIGFAMASGDIIGYLNADDYYLPGALTKAANRLENGVSFVVGPIIVLDERGRVRINRGGTSLQRMLRHWILDAFCINPVGYFYRREVQSAIGGFNVDNHYAMDLEFLLAAASLQPLTWLETQEPLGVFRRLPNTKTSSTQNAIETWSEDFFAFLDAPARTLGPVEYRQYQRERRRAYAFRRAQAKGNARARETQRVPPGTLQAAALWTELKLRRIVNRAAFADVGISANRFRHRDR